MGGDTLTLSTAQGPAANLTATAIIALDGNPTFILAGGILTFDATGRRALSGTVPSGFAGHTMTLRSTAVDAASRVVYSVDEVVTFQ
jgi:hypothetical protein